MQRWRKMPSTLAKINGYAPIRVADGKILVLVSIEIGRIDPFRPIEELTRRRITCGDLIHQGSQVREKLGVCINGNKASQPAGKPEKHAGALEDRSVFHAAGLNT